MRERFKKIGSIALMGILASGFAASSALAEEEKPSADLSVSLLSKYVWRGWEYSKDSMVVQPSITVAYKGFSANLWGNLDTDNDITNTNEFNETDFTLAYDGSCSFADYSVGYIYYALDNANDTQEVYASATFDMLLSPTIAVYRDYDSFPGWYITLGISHSVPVGEYALDLGAQAGYYDVADSDVDGGDYSEFHDGLLSASMTFPVGEYFAVTPELYYSFPLTSDSEDQIEFTNTYSNDSDYIYGGVTLSMSF